VGAAVIVTQVVIVEFLPLAVLVAERGFLGLFLVAQEIPLTQAPHKEIMVEQHQLLISRALVVAGLRLLEEMQTPLQGS
jgi:hypothetical protein